MKCPKCNAEQPDHNEICTGCGLVFEKYYKYHPREGGAPLVEIKTHRPAARVDRATDRGMAMDWEFLVPPHDRQTDWVALGGRAFILLVIVLWGGTLVFSSLESNAAGESFLHLINLPFHEAGHVIFSPFGRFIQSLGGTLGQLLMPAICCGVLLFQTRDPFGASVALWWFGENFLDIAPYINDASRGVLPLIGGNTGRHAPYGFHDWEYLLTESGLIRFDHQIAVASHLIGSLIMLLAVAWAAWLLYRDYLGLKKGR